MSDFLFARQNCTKNVGEVTMFSTFAWIRIKCVPSLVIIRSILHTIFSCQLGKVEPVGGDHGRHGLGPHLHLLPELVPRPEER